MEKTKQGGLSTSYKDEIAREPEKGNTTGRSRRLHLHCKVGKLFFAYFSTFRQVKNFCY